MKDGLKRILTLRAFSGQKGRIGVCTDSSSAGETHIYDAAEKKKHSPEN